MNPLMRCARSTPPVGGMCGCIQFWIRAGSVLAMFGFGNQKDKLREKYSKLMQESFDLSTVNREKSDQKRAEAEEVGKRLDALEKRA